jgi:hypothetical protein
MTGKLTPTETLRAILDQARVYDIEEETASMTDEARERDLASAGVDVDAARKKLDAIRARLAPKLEVTPKPAAPPGKVVDIRTRPKWAPSRAFVGFSAFVAFAACMGLFMDATGLIVIRPTPHPTATGTGAPPNAEAEELRSRAYRACAGGHYKECIELFDRAKTLDSTGDQDVDVVSARDNALRFMKMSNDGG